LDWVKVKKQILFFLALLNVSLFVLIYVNNRAYSLPQGRQQLITSLLRENNITCYVDILANFSPMRQIEMQPPDYDAGAFVKLLVSDPESIVKSVERNKNIYKNDRETLIIDDTEVSYRNRSGVAEIIISSEDAEIISTELLKKINGLGGNFTADRLNPIETEYGWLFQYKDRYRGYIINSNSLEITVNGNGIASVSYRYLKPAAFIGARREICSADEALLTVMREIKNIYGENMEPKLITRMEIVYHNNFSARATPYYRVHISGRETPFLINAYENTIL